MKLLSNIAILMILCALVGCHKSPNVILENGMYIVIKLDSTNYLVSPTTSNSNLRPFILKLDNKDEKLIKCYNK